jgi:hypothetical protein
VFALRSPADVTAQLDACRHSRWPACRTTRPGSCIAEARGNPLALPELPQEVSQLCEPRGGFGPPVSYTIPARLEESFRMRLNLLPPQLRQLL